MIEEHWRCRKAVVHPYTHKILRKSERDYFMLPETAKHRIRKSSGDGPQGDGAIRTWLVLEKGIQMESNRYPSRTKMLPEVVEPEPTVVSGDSEYLYEEEVVEAAAARTEPPPKREKATK